MSIFEFCSSISKNLTGTFTVSSDFDKVRKTFDDKMAPDWLQQVMCNFALAGSCFSLSDSDDISELGVELKWMSAMEIISEGTDAFPGILATKHGYLPIGICLEGSGDPYFLNMNKYDTPLVRIPHDSCSGGNFDMVQIELVNSSLIEFLKKAEIYK